MSGGVLRFLLLLLPALALSACQTRAERSAEIRLQSPESLAMDVFTNICVRPLADEDKIMAHMDEGRKAGLVSDINIDKLDGVQLKDDRIAHAWKVTDYVTARDYIIITSEKHACNVLGKGVQKAAMRAELKKVAEKFAAKMKTQAKWAKMPSDQQAENEAYFMPFTNDPRGALMAIFLPLSAEDSFQLLWLPLTSDPTRQQ